MPVFTEPLAYALKQCVTLLNASGSDGPVMTAVCLPNFAVFASASRLYFESDALLAERQAVLGALLGHGQSLIVALQQSVAMPMHTGVAIQAGVLTLVTSSPAVGRVRPPLLSALEDGC